MYKKKIVLNVLFIVEVFENKYYYYYYYVNEWLTQCVACVKRKSPVGHHHPLGNIPTGHRWDRIAMDILDVCDPTTDGHRYILVIADYFRKWTRPSP